MNETESFGLLTIAAGLLAYMYETREPVAVKMETVTGIFEIIKETGKLPQFAIDERDGYLVLGAVMRDPEETKENES